MTGRRCRRRLPRTAWALVVSTLWSAGALDAQEEGQNLNDWLNQTIDRILETRVEQTSSSTQVEGPSALGSSTTLVDHASASDLIGFALQPATFPRAESGDAERTSQVFTLSPYAILAALTGRDPDDPWLYQQNEAWRLFAITLGLEDVSNDVSGTDERAFVLGLKLKVWNKRNVDAADAGLRQDLLTEPLTAATGAFARITTAIQNEVAGLQGATTRQDTIAVIERLGEADGFRVIMDGLSPDQRSELVEAIEAEIQPFIDLRRAAAEAVAQMRGQPQLSLAVTARMSQSGRDEVRVGIAFDKDLASGIAWTLSGGLDYRQAFGGLDGEYGGTVATEIAFPLTQQRLSGPRPARLAIAAEGSAMQDQEAEARVQAKLVLPLAQGLELPISVTWASRSELIDESDVFGQVGFTVDTAALQRALGG